MEVKKHYAIVDDECSIKYFKKLLDSYYGELKGGRVNTERRSWLELYIDDCKDAIEQLKERNTQNERSE